MAAIVTDQFRISNANNFIDSIKSSNNSYYIFLGLPNPTSVGFGRTTGWNTNTPSPIDNLNYLTQYKDSALFGKKITPTNVKRVIRRINWTFNTRYEMYRHDYSVTNPSPVSQSNRLYDSNYYVLNSDYRLYICISNGSSSSNLTGNQSQEEPKFQDIEPSAAGNGGDGYLWKYLFTVNPSDIIKFDSTDYITLPDDWSTSTDESITTVRENGNSILNLNQIKTVYIDNPGSGYSSGQVNILGDGTGARLNVTAISGQITNVEIIAGGSGYTYGIVDLGSLQPGGSITNPARLIPIIPPSLGHGYDLYSELGADKVLIYSRFDDSTKDFPTDAAFSQIGIVKNPVSYASTSIFVDAQYSSLYSIKFIPGQTGTLLPGDLITQTYST